MIPRFSRKLYIFYTFYVFPRFFDVPRGYALRFLRPFTFGRYFGAFALPLERFVARPVRGPRCYQSDASAFVFDSTSINGMHSCTLERFHCLWSVSLPDQSEGFDAIISMQVH